MIILIYSTLHHQKFYNYGLLSKKDVTLGMGLNK